VLRISWWGEGRGRGKIRLDKKSRRRKKGFRSNIIYVFTSNNKK